MRIEPGLDVFPDGIGRGFEDITSGDIVVRDHLALGNDLLVPLSKVDLFRDIDTDKRRSLNLTCGEQGKKCKRAQDVCD